MKTARLQQLVATALQLNCTSIQLLTSQGKRNPRRTELQCHEATNATILQQVLRPGEQLPVEILENIADTALATKSLVDTCMRAMHEQEVKDESRASTTDSETSTEESE